MLRQALDDAARGQQQQKEAESSGATETDALLSAPTHTENPRYDSQPQDFDPGDSRSSDEEDAGYSVSDWNDDEGVALDHTPSLVARAWDAIKGFVLLVVNVENLWDSPEGNESQNVSRRKKNIVFLWFFILAISYACERSTFKFLVDRSGPFRLVAVEMVTFAHAAMLGLGMLISAASRKDFTLRPLGIPGVDVLLMALLDTVHLLLVFLTGYHVPPTNTVILVQFMLPLTALITQFVHPDGFVKRCFAGSSRQPSGDGQGAVSPGPLEGQPIPGWGGLSLEHIWGCIIITLAVLLALVPAFYSIWDPFFFIYADTIPLQTAYNTILFVSSCVPAAASQIYKEHIFLQYKQPVQADFLNFLLSVFQFIFASIISPLVYALLGFAGGENWPSLYPSSGFSKNVVEGIKCFLGTLDEERALNGYVDEAQCEYFSMGLVMLHSFSIIAVGVAVDKIVNAGATKVMFRGVSAGIVVSVISLYVYDTHSPDFNYGPAIDSLNLVCVLLLTVGSEVYHRVSLQDATFETVYPEVQNFYDDI